MFIDSHDKTALRQEGHVYRLGRRQRPALRQEGHVLINRPTFCKSQSHIALLTEGALIYTPRADGAPPYKHGPPDGGQGHRIEVYRTARPADEHTALR